MNGMQTTAPQPRKKPCTLDQLHPDAYKHVANYFQTLAEPMRLRILNALRQGEASVSELAQRQDTSLPNMSRHLNQLCKAGLIARESRGTNAYYRIKDPRVFSLCDVVCNTVAEHMFEAQFAWSEDPPMSDQTKVAKIGDS